MRLLFIISCFMASMFAQAQTQKEFLPVKQAFPYSQSVVGNELIISFDTVPGYYLYQKRLSFKSASPELTLGEPIFSVTAQQKQDPYFGEVGVFRQPLRVRVPFEGAGKVKVRFQGCADDGLCYMPQTKSVELQAL
ncbi:hypothetical protein FM037_20835 [Shewanella psychropiezotolerans]|uniref:Thiol:disulfide interchange protein DsbD N-terminal domain-containing protein n=1 Tax=Shewanella psychropiezotolerans TaxID=2593655 RepID=A0ABX5X1M3_9GAMM|nr:MULTISPECIES: protein-disulfide reductase DsbD domain-containing protein [Shewanella]MPY21095.1 hypothetical protein [Shewanella sp. YLB-07]MPY21882.1 hypothetical protein [Shewanella sp. YLB-07]QDO85240.1 hypothetical protein FM037_20835 [Shewanella psychropiezotolerans]